MNLHYPRFIFPNSQYSFVSINSDRFIMIVDVHVTDGITSKSVSVVTYFCISNTLNLRKKMTFSNLIAFLLLRYIDELKIPQMNCFMLIGIRTSYSIPATDVEEQKEHWYFL